LYTLADLMLKLGFGKAAPHRPSSFGESRHVMVHVTIDAQHATPLRRALVRDCAGEPWTIRVTPLHDTSRVRLTLIVPKAAVDGALKRLTDMAPSAEISSLMEIPDSPSDAWRDVMDRSVPRDDSVTSRRPAAQTSTPGMLATLLRAEHVLLGLHVTDRNGLFDAISHFLANRHGLSFADVHACLAAREALGSTALGEGVAVPHGQIDALHQPMVLYIRPDTPVPFDAPDGEPVTDFVTLLVPERATFTHLHLLGEVAEHFCDRRFRELLHQCADADAVCSLFARRSADDFAH
jgi:PTS system nitrogen regulatory IIA component